MQRLGRTASFRQLTHARVGRLDLGSAPSARLHHDAAKADAEAHLALVALVARRQLFEQCQRPPIVALGHVMGAAASIGLRRMLEVVDSARQIAAELEVRRQLRRPLRRAVAIGRFESRPDQAMHLDAASRRRACAQHLSIERMKELVGGRQRPVRPLDRRAFAHEGMSSGQRRECLFHRGWRHAGAGRDRRAQSRRCRSGSPLRAAGACPHPADRSGCSIVRRTSAGMPSASASSCRLTVHRSPRTTSSSLAIKSFSALTMKSGLPSVR